MKDYRKVEPDLYAITHANRYTKGRSAKIAYITRHHTAGKLNAAAINRVWADRPASAHYLVDYNGIVSQHVNDSDTAWSNADSYSNARSISIEHSNDGGPDWSISDKTIVEGARWAAALCLFYKLGRPEFGNNIRDHREFGSTSCPHHLAKGGKYHQRWMNEAQRFYDELAGKKTEGAPMAERYWPLPRNQIRITSRFAGRTNPVTGRPENHSGTDFAAPDGTPFYACQSGTVQFIGPASGYGQWLVIDSSDAEGSGCVEYGHMWNAYATGLKVGDKVRAGQLIGYVGSNGQSTGPHLHVTVWERGYGGRRIDPETWLSGAKYLGEQEHEPSNEGSSPVLTQKYFTDFITGWLGPQIDALQEVWTQLRGPGGKGWEQLGQNSKGQNLTLVDAVASIRYQLVEIEKKVDNLEKGRK